MFFCHAFEDNSGALEISKLQNTCSWTKHTIIFYHHFSECVKQGERKIHAINTEDQVADMVTKLLPQKCYKSIINLCLKCESPCQWLTISNAQKILFDHFSPQVSPRGSVRLQIFYGESATLFYIEIHTNWQQECRVFWRSVGWCFMSHFGWLIIALKLAMIHQFTWIGISYCKCSWCDSMRQQVTLQWWRKKNKNAF